VCSFVPSRVAIISSRLVNGSPGDWAASGPARDDHRQAIERTRFGGRLAIGAQRKLAVRAFVIAILLSQMNLVRRSLPLPGALSAALAAAACGTAPSASAPAVEQARAQAIAARELEGKARSRAYENAARLLDERLAEAPDDADALRWRAHCKTALEQHDRALADLDAALRLEPRVAWAHYARAMALRSLGRLDEAILGYERALAEECDAALARKALQWRGFTRGQRGEQDGAVADLTRALELGPKDAWTLVARAKAHLAAGRIDDAELDLFAAHDVEPDDPDAEAQLGYLCAVRGEDGRATVLLSRAASRAPALQQEARLWLALLEPERSRQHLLGLDSGWTGAVAAFLAGTGGDADLRAAAAREAEDRRAEVAFWIGARALLEGRVTEARQALAQARAARQCGSWEWWLAERWLARADANAPAKGR
jgi:tetratricopeptide (TPR) repeat protein